jgi:hypothetical protein
VVSLEQEEGPVNTRNELSRASAGGTRKYAGQFHWVNAVVVDSKGNIYSGGVEQAKLIQKFMPAMEAGR